MMDYRAIIFDLDGTLIDSIEGINYSMNSVLAERGFPQHSVETCKTFVGHGIRRLVEQAIPGDKAEVGETESCFRAMLAAYSLHWDRKMKPYEGIPELLDHFQEAGCSLCVNTSKDEQTARRILGRFLPGNDFALVVGRDTVDAPKPDPAGVRYMMNQLNLEAADFLYIGDSEVDVETARHAGVDCIGVEWGFRSRKNLVAAGTPRIVNHPGEIIELLNMV